MRLQDPCGDDDYACATSGGSLMYEQVSATRWRVLEAALTQILWCYLCVPGGYTYKQVASYDITD